ncbi:hypothetical protein CCYA_CCYA01G0309 [Cyanidiococcus yangmingshanensis]|nr:hypothetical protein CCYA_CCYA01G0309 [Cyanidiococcus yangmingshanensis]
MSATPLLAVTFVVLYTSLFVFALFIPCNRGNRDEPRVIRSRSVSTFAVVTLSLVSLSVTFDDISLKRLMRTYHWLEPWHRWRLCFFDNIGFLILLATGWYTDHRRSARRKPLSYVFAANTGHEPDGTKTRPHPSSSQMNWCWIRSVIVAPISEELLFRCVFDAALSAALMPEGLSILLNGALFAMAHCHHYFRHKNRALLGRQLLITLSFGWLQAWNLRRTDRSIWNCVATHMLANALEYASIFRKKDSKETNCSVKGEKVLPLARAVALTIFILRYALDFAELASPFAAELTGKTLSQHVHEVNYCTTSPTVPFSLFLIEYHPNDPVFGRVMALCSMLPQLLFVAEVTAVYCLRSPHALSLAIGQLSNELLSYTLKRLCKEPRPPVWRLETDAFGWPSSHAQFMAFLLTFFILSTYPAERSKTMNRDCEYRAGTGRVHRYDSGDEREAKMLLFGLTASSVLVSASRVYLGYHYVCQVWYGIGAGATFGVFWFAMTERVLMPIIRRVRLFAALGFSIN